MTLDEAIQRQKEAANGDCCGCAYMHCSDCYREHEKLAEWLEDYKELKETTRWIQCSERMPEVGEPVLIYDPVNEEMVVASLDCDKIGFSNDDCWYGLRNVPFWMPIPEMPKGDAK